MVGFQARTFFSCCGYLLFLSTTPWLFSCKTAGLVGSTTKDAASPGTEQVEITWIGSASTKLDAIKTASQSMTTMAVTAQQDFGSGIVQQLLTQTQSLDSLIQDLQEYLAGSKVIQGQFVNVPIDSANGLVGINQVITQTSDLRTAVESNLLGQVGKLSSNVDAAHNSALVAFLTALPLIQNQIDQIRQEITQWSAASGGAGSSTGGSSVAQQLTLTESFVYATDYSLFHQDYFGPQAQNAATACQTWINQVKATTTGQLISGTCAPASQTTVGQNVAANVVGTITLSFQNGSGAPSPAQVGGEANFVTDFSLPHVDYLMPAAKSAIDACAAWQANFVKQSKGSIVYAACGGLAIKQTLGNFAVSVSGKAAVTWQAATNGAPIVLDNAFLGDTGFSLFHQTYWQNAVNLANAACQKWTKDTLANSAGVPVLVSCLGPSAVQSGGNVQAQFTGKIIFAQ